MKEYRLFYDNAMTNMESKLNKAALEGFVLRCTIGGFGYEFDGESESSRPCFVMEREKPEPTP